MNPDPSPHPVRMNTVALRASSIALRAGDDSASCASRPEDAEAVAGDAPGGAERGAGGGALTLAGVFPRPCMKPYTIAPVIRAVSAIPPSPIPDGSGRDPLCGGAAWSDCCCWNFAK